MILRICSGVLPSGVASSLRIFCCMSGSLKPLPIASEIFWVIDFAGLGWEDSCAEFHRTDRPVATASLYQVRRPVYGSSVGKWRRYEAQLQPLIAALGDDRAHTGKQ